MSPDKDRGRRFLAVGLLLLLLGGCAAYHPAPLSEAQVSRSLSPPDSQSVRLAASALHYPYLHPIALDFRDGISSEEAAVLAVVTNPQLRAARARKGVAAAQLIAAGVLPDPELSSGIELPVADTTGAVTGWSLGLSFDLGALLTRSSERASARAHLEQISLDLAWQEWQVAQAARRQVFDIVFLQRQAALAKEQEDALGEQLRVLTDARKRRLVAETDRAAAETAYLQARAERLDLTTQLDTTRLGLLRLLGFPPDAHVRIDPLGVPYASSGDRIEPGGTAGAGPYSGNLDTAAIQVPVVPGADSLLADLQQRRIDLVALRYGYESQDAALRAAILRQFPSINIGLTHSRGTDRVLSIGPTVSVRLPFFDRNHGEIAVERATREQLRQEYVARLFDARSVIGILVSQVAGLQQRLLAAEASAHAQRVLVTAYGAALRQGDADVLTYYAARKSLIDSEIAVVQFRQALASGALALETETGGLLTMH